MKKKLLSLLLSASMAVSLTPTIALANETAQQTGSSNTYTVDLKDWKVGVNGATPVDAQIGTTGIILYPGDKLVWTSTATKEPFVNGMMDHHDDNNWPYKYSQGVGFSIIKAGTENEKPDASICTIETKDYQIVNGGISDAGKEDSSENLEYATVNVDDSMTAHVPMLVKGKDGGKQGVYYTKCKIHPECNWNAYYYGVGHTFTVDPLTDQKANLQIVIDADAIGASDYPTSVTLGKDPFTMKLTPPTRAGYTFGGWKIVDENDDERTFKALFTKNADGSLYYPGLSTSIWNDVRNAIGKTIYIKPQWRSASDIDVTLDGNGGVVWEGGSSSYAYLSVIASLRSLYVLGYSAVRPGYDFQGWYLEEHKIEKLADIPTDHWNPDAAYTLKAKWKRNSDTESFTLDPSTKKLTILNAAFFDFNKNYNKWQGSIKQIDITKNITRIPDSAFLNYNALTSVVVPDSVTSVGYYAFSNCDALKSVYVPSSVTKIGNDAFGYHAVDVYCEKGSYAEQYVKEQCTKNNRPYNLKYLTTDDTKTETKPSTETKEDGTKDETKADGTKDETKADGSKDETKTDGTRTETNAKGNEVNVTITTEKDASGKVTGITQTSEIDQISGSASATVTVEKTADGKITSAEAEVEKKGASSKQGVSATLSGSVVSQITEAAGTKSVEISMTVTAGKKEYTVKADAQDLEAGNKLKVMAIDEKTGSYVLVNAKTYTVSKSGSVKVVLPEGATYQMMDTKEAAAVEKQIMNSVKAKKTAVTVERGKKTAIQLNSKLDMDNVEKITYSTSKKSVATVNKNGTVTTKKSGKVTIQAKVLLKNGKTKTVKMTVTVKP